MYRKHRLFGKLSVVVPETLRLFDGTLVEFNYPFEIDGRETRSTSIYEVYTLAFRYGERFKIIEARRYYSGQEKKIIKKLKKLGEEKNGSLEISLFC